MAVHGLFTRVELKAGKAPGAKKASGGGGGRRKGGGPVIPKVDPAIYWNRGLAGVDGMNPDAVHKHIEPVGSETPAIYCLGEAPGEQEDSRGEPFVGKSGNMLKDQFPAGWFPEHIRINNVVRTWPALRDHKRDIVSSLVKSLSKTGATRQPTYEEIECYRPSLIADIERTKPTAIIGVGGVALDWMLPGVGSILVARGKRFPVKVGAHCCWFYPVHHPAFLMRIEDSRFMDIPGEEWRRQFEIDIRRVFKEVSAGLPVPEVEDLTKLDENCELFDGSDPGAIADAIQLMYEAKLGMVDYETTHLRPYNGGKILTVGLSRGDYHFAFPLHHPGAKWASPDDQGWVERQFVKWLESGTPKGCQNGSMELEWTGYTYGKKILRKSDWHDTRAQAYLRYGVGGTSLNFLTALEFGFQLKGETELNKSNLAGEPLPKVLRYNVWDAKYQHKLWFKQNKWIKQEGLTDVYLEQIRRLPTLVLAQLKGIPTDQAKVDEFEKKCDTERETLRKQILDFPEAKAYQKKYGAILDPDKDKDLLQLFEGREEIKRGKDSFSTDKDVLAELEKKGLKIAPVILRMRQWKKIKSTYVTPMRLGHKKGVVKPDGFLHTILKPYGTASRRLASEDPNNQNWPKRRDAWVRAIMAMVEQLLGIKCTLVSADFAQIEYRGIGNCSGDKTIIDSCFTGYDVHMEIAERILKDYTDTFKERHGHKDKKKAMKDWRGEVKNQAVFPYFYRSRPESIARDLQMPFKVFKPIFDEMEDRFAGIKPWQDRSIQFYHDNNYIELLTGFRRYGPLSDNMICNTIPQGTASDIVVDAMNRLSEMADRIDQWHLSPVLNVHDDLWFIVPDKFVDDSLPIIIREMCNCPFPWLSVPLGIEVSVGRDAGNMTEVGKYESHKLPPAGITTAETRRGLETVPWVRRDLFGERSGQDPIRAA
jgi:DNA polymerase I-like protein with 3'-5' exonuclease and polymerase domains/uracil-DNA glycosylase